MENKDLKEKQDLIKEYFKEQNERKKLNKTSKSEINTHYNPKNINYNINIETLSHSRQNVCFAQNIEKEMQQNIIYTQARILLRKEANRSN